MKKAAKTDVEQCVSVFKALADGTRLRILEMLVGEDLCACKILERFSISQPTLSYHMKILCDAGLVSGLRDGTWMRYSVIPAVFGEASELLRRLNAAERES